MTKKHRFISPVSMPRKLSLALALVGVLSAAGIHAETVTVGIGTQNTTTNTMLAAS